MTLSLPIRYSYKPLINGCAFCRRAAPQPINLIDNSSIQASAAAPIAAPAAIGCNRPSPGVAHPVRLDCCRACTGSALRECCRGELSIDSVEPADCFLSRHSAANFNSPSFSLVVRRVPPQSQHTTPAAGKKGAAEVTLPFPRYLTGHQGTGVCLSVASQKVKRCIRMIAVIILNSSAALRLDQEAWKVVRRGRC